MPNKKSGPDIQYHGSKTDLHQQAINTTNKKCKTKGVNWKEWENNSKLFLKGTLMQILKSSCMF